jgi:hypothetical protein
MSSYTLYLALVKILISFRVLAHTLLMQILKGESGVYPKEFYDTRHDLEVRVYTVMMYHSGPTATNEKVSLTGRVQYPAPHVHAHRKGSYVPYPRHRLRQP